MRHSPAAALRRAEQSENVGALQAQSASFRLDTAELRARDLERERTRDRVKGLGLVGERKPEPKDETAAYDPLSVPFMSTPSSDTERYRLQAKTADLRRDEAERKCTKLREQLASAEAKLYLVQSQKEQQDLQLAGVEERLQTLNKLRDAATHDKFQQERDLSRLRAELEASKAGVTKREAELTLAQQELARKEKHAASGEIALQRQVWMKRGRSCSSGIYKSLRRKSKTLRLPSLVFVVLVGVWYTL
jgi:glutamate synthase domain-containing protein 2